MKNITFLALCMCTAPLVACHTIPPEKAVNAVKDVFEAARWEYQSKGMTPKAEFEFEEAEKFDGQLWASLASDRHLKNVRVTFAPADREKIPTRLRKWVWAAQLTSAPVRVCDVNTSQSSWVDVVIDGLKVVSTYEPVKDYRVVLEYNSSNNENIALVFYDKSISSESQESKGKYASCHDMKFSEVISG